MKLLRPLERTKTKIVIKTSAQMKDLASFVKVEFKQLTRKNLQIPVKLYHL